MYRYSIFRLDTHLFMELGDGEHVMTKFFKVQICGSYRGKYSLFFGDTPIFLDRNLLCQKRAKSIQTFYTMLARDTDTQTQAHC